jgi:hypothetical protein
MLASVETFVFRSDASRNAFRPIHGLKYCHWGHCCCSSCPIHLHYYFDCHLRCVDFFEQKWIVSFEAWLTFSIPANFWSSALLGFLFFDSTNCFLRVYGYLFSWMIVAAICPESHCFADSTVDVLLCLTNSNLAEAPPSNEQFLSY